MQETPLVEESSPTEIVRRQDDDRDLGGLEMIKNLHSNQIQQKPSVMT